MASKDEGVSGVGFRSLLVYQRMMDLTLLVYDLTKRLPNDERYGLISQMRRAGVSVVSNFVEGYHKKSAREKDVYLERSMTSLHELDAQVEICFRLGFILEEDYNNFSHKKGEVGYLLFRYRKQISA